jgi:regulation of enolase protein 1 (concanavalin A-like superfamily)
MPLENIVNADIVVTSQTDIADKNTIYNQLIGYGYTGKKKKHTSNNDVIELTPPKNSTISINNVHINRKVQYVTLYDYFIVVVYADDGNLFEATIEYNDIQNFNLS